MGLQAAEQLVTELAAGRVGADFNSTQVQKELNIPTFLVYLFGIVIAEEEYQRWRNHKPAPKGQETQHHFSSIREKRFSVFQKQYFASAKITSFDGAEKGVQTTSQSEPKPYQLTTRILPSKDQQAIVKRDLLAECEKLESLSNEALEALLMEESYLSQQALTKSKRKKKKKKNRQQPIASIWNDAALKSGEEETRSSMKEVVDTTPQDSSAERFDEKILCAETKSKSESEVKKKSSLHNVVSNEVNTTTSNLPKDQVDEGFELTTNVCCDSSFSDIVDNSNEKKVSSLTNDVSRVEKDGSLLGNLISPPSPRTNDLPNLNTAGDHFNLHPPVIDASVLTQRITALEHNLAEANRRSREERLAHTKAMRKEKERYENLIQSLQLRLYISENKVRTYEDALEKHIESISAINSGGRSIKKNNYEEQTPNSPSLISKVLEGTRVTRNGEV